MQKGKMNSELPTSHVLVVGDWVIDENWIIASYESDTSSHIGSEHFRSTIEKADSQILGLCGAGNVARSLHGLHPKEIEKEPRLQRAIQVHGLGLWHKEDTKLLASLFSNDTIRNQTPLTLCGMEPTGQAVSEERHSLCGLAVSPGVCVSHKKADEKKCPASDRKCKYLHTLNLGPSCTTVRAIRMYYSTAGNDPKLRSRIDWELSRPVHPEKDRIKKALDELDLPDGAKIDHIVVSDHHHGCITDDLVIEIRDKFPHAYWYVRTKNMKVKWIDEIEKANRGMNEQGEERLRLRMIGADFIPNRSKTKRWFYGTEVSQEAIDELKEIGGLVDLKDTTERWVIAMNDDNSMLALHKVRDKKLIEAIALVDKPQRLAINVGRSSIVFASCVASLIGCNPDTSDEQMLTRASNYGHNWSKTCVNRFRSRQKYTGKGDNDGVPIVLHADHSAAIRPKLGETEDSVSCHAHNLGDVTKIEWRWRSAYGSDRIVNNEFHLWRGYTCIDRYIAIRKRIRGALNELHQAISDFVNNRTRYSSLNCLILGSPGFGKTFLAQRLAATFTLTPLFFNLAQLTSLEQVIDCFDSISSLQNQRRRQPILVFFDEFDALIENQCALSLFLSPMLDGTYRRGSHIFRLDPCIWLFAGVTIPDRQVYPKSRDFSTRINGPRLELGCTSEERKTSEPGSEQIYWGVRLLIQRYPDISWVSKEVLDFFGHLELVEGPRGLHQAVMGFRNVQYGEVRARNLPQYDYVAKLIGQHKPKADYEKLLNTKEKDETLIPIQEEPPSAFE